MEIPFTYIKHNTNILNLHIELAAINHQNLNRNSICGFTYNFTYNILENIVTVISPSTLMRTNTYVYIRLEPKLRIHQITALNLDSRNTNEAKMVA